MIHLSFRLPIPHNGTKVVSACDWGNPLKCFRGDPNLWQQLLFQNKFDAIWQQLLFPNQSNAINAIWEQLQRTIPEAGYFWHVTIGDDTDKFSDCATSHFTQIHLVGQSL